MEVIQLVLPVAVAVAAVVGAIIAAWRMIPHRPGAEAPTARLDAIEEAVEAVRMSVLDLGDKYEVTIRRNNVRVGRLRRKVARLQGDDVDEDQDDADEMPATPASPANPIPGPMTKVQMWAAYNANHPNGGGR